jgi:phosphohistidine phosphatase
MDIYFVRHANAGEHTADPKQDEKRPLDELGIKQSQDMGAALKALKVQVDVIISSPLTRATQTAAHVAQQLGYEKSVLLDSSLRPEGKFDKFRQLLQRQSGKTAIMVVGHNPSLSEFVSLLVSDEAANSTVELKKGAVAKLELKSRKPSLQWILTPKTVEAIQEASTTKSRPKTSRK